MSERVCGGLAGATTAIVACSGRAGGLIRSIRRLLPLLASAPRETLSIASAISSRGCLQRAEHELDVELGHLLELQRPPGSNQSATPVHWRRIA